MSAVTAAPLLQFFAAGFPAPGGSKRAFAIKKAGAYTGRTVVIDMGGQRTKDWRAAIGWQAKEAMAGRPLYAGNLIVNFEFTMPRPKFHSGKRGLKPNAPLWHANKPDLTKLIRSSEDALKGIVWLDDTQVVAQRGSKRYGDAPGCLISIWAAEDARQGAETPPDALSLAL